MSYMILNGNQENSKHTNYHHEDTPSFQKYFFQDITKLYNITWNPFEMNELTRIG